MLPSEECYNFLLSLDSSLAMYNVDIVNITENSQYIDGNPDLKPGIMNNSIIAGSNDVINAINNIKAIFLFIESFSSLMYCIK